MTEQMIADLEASARRRLDARVIAAIERRVRAYARVAAMVEANLARPPVLPEVPQ